MIISIRRRRYPLLLRRHVLILIQIQKIVTRPRHVDTDLALPLIDNRLKSARHLLLSVGILRDALLLALFVLNVDPETAGGEFHAVEALADPLEGLYELLFI